MDEYFFDDLDTETTVLMARLAERDLEALLVAPALSDEELAWQLQAQSFINALRIIEDRRFAESLDEGVTYPEHDVAHAAMADDDPLATVVPVLQAQTVSPQGSPVISPDGDSASGVTAGDLDDHDLRSSSPPLKDTESVESPPYVDDETTSGSETREFIEPHPSITPQLECTGCTDNIDPLSVHLRANCGHDYCSACLIKMVELCTHDESLFPLGCCRLPFSSDALLPSLPSTLASCFLRKTIEFAIPASDRVYCPNSRCSSFLGSSDVLDRRPICEDCETTICVRCRHVSHVQSGQTCTEVSETLGFLQVTVLAEENHWPTCPGCQAIIELSGGCNHMTCRCKMQFCYLCTAPWKTCTCPQFDEEL